MADANVDLVFPRTDIPWDPPSDATSSLARNLVDTRMDSINELVATARAAFDDSMKDLEAAVSNINVSEIGTDPGDILVDVNAPADKPSLADYTWQDGTVALEDALVEKLALLMTGQTPAIDAATLTTIYEAEEIRIDEARVAATLKAESDVAARGWAIPAGVLTARTTQIEAEYAKRITELGGTLAGKNMELTQQATLTGTQLGQAYVAAAGDYLVKKNTARVEAYKSAIDAWVAEYKAIADVETETAKVQAEIFQIVTSAQIEKEKVTIQALTANQNLVERIAETKANLYAQIVSAGLSGVHVQAGVSASGNDSRSGSWSRTYGEGYSESQSKSVSTSYSPSNT